MTRHTVPLTDHLHAYLLSMSLREPDAMRRLREQTRHHPLANMQIAPEQAQFMALLVQLMGARRTLEIGVFTGYSALAVALALPPEGRVTACEVNADYAAIARGHWEAAGVAERIALHVAPALETLDRLILDGQLDRFDFAFIDADKQHYGEYYERCLRLVRPGGLIAVDNVLWNGKVADSHAHDPETNALRAFNRKLLGDARVALSMVPIGDGLTLALKR